MTEIEVGDPVGFPAPGGGYVGGEVLSIADGYAQVRVPQGVHGCRVRDLVSRKQTGDHIVKWTRGGTSSVRSIGTQAECEALAEWLNRAYQNNEYTVEPYRPKGTT